MPQIINITKYRSARPILLVVKCRFGRLQSLSGFKNGFKLLCENVSQAYIEMYRN